jgi:uncharacterized UBP type Zn finger protein
MAGTMQRRRKPKNKDAIAHRTGRAKNYYNISNPRYLLRNRPAATAAPAVPGLFPLNSARQVEVDRINRGIPRTWPHRRQHQSNASRGMKQDDSECYRLAALQCILHMPKAMNWIMSHNDGNDNGVAINQCAVSRGNCIACAMKRLIRRYWEDDSHATRPNPKSLSRSTSSLHRIHNLADANPTFAPGRQGDPQEFLTWVLRECRNVTVPASHRALWEDRYDALFMLMEEETRFCQVCDNPITQVPARDGSFRQPEFGFEPLGVADPRNPGYIADLVAAHMADETPNSITRFCGACAQNQGIRKHFRIEEAPEYLTIRVQTHTSWDKAKKRYNRVDPVGINDVLDLTQYQMTPWTQLRYKLVATTDYSGNGKGGHWVATVRRHPQVYAINSGFCEGKDKAFLLENPRHHGSKRGGTSSFQATLFVYARQY